jgi:uncharacterized protein (DUF433 family)
MKTRFMGEHVIVAPEIRGGAPVFRETRILVADVLEQVARNRPWPDIVAEQQGAISEEAIAEAVRLASAVFLEHARVPPKDELDAPPTILGEYLVADPAICHGTPTFRGSRVFVADILNEVADGMTWAWIVQQWHGSVSNEAIAEAVRVAARFFVRHANDLVAEPAST